MPSIFGLFACLSPWNNPGASIKGAFFSLAFVLGKIEGINYAYLEGLNWKKNNHPKLFSRDSEIIEE